MRPRVFPAEDGGCRTGRVAALDGFNEAAGIPRGRRPYRRRVRVPRASFNEAAGIPRGRRRPAFTTILSTYCASMRPRVFPAEDSDCRTNFGCSLRRFNEAAGIPRGRRATPRRWRVRASSFNEAAGIPRGRHARVGHTTPQIRCRGFNEAAGIPRGRHHGTNANQIRRSWAFRSFNEAAGIPRGRLPERALRTIADPARYASMRPRVFPAEDWPILPLLTAPWAALASMRPRVFPAEDPQRSPSGA